MGVLRRKHNPWFVFPLWVILIVIGILEAWAILLQGKNYPTWQYVLYLLGIVLVGLCWLSGMFISTKRQICENKAKSYDENTKLKKFNNNGKISHFI